MSDNSTPSTRFDGFTNDCEQRKASHAVPAVRFKGFINPWQTRRFEELYTKVIEKNGKTVTFDSNHVISVARMQWSPTIKQFDAEYAKTYNVFRVGDIAFEGNRSGGFAYGRFVANDLGNGIVSHVFDVFRPVNEAQQDDVYMRYFIHNENVMRDVLRKSTTRATMMNSLDTPSLNHQLLHVPGLEEQQKIASLLSSVDETITLCRRKLDLLTQAKKALMQQIFSRKLRFTGFNDVWKVARGVELFEQFSDKGYPQLPVLSATQDQGMVLRSETDRQIIQNTNHFDSYKRVRPGQFVIHLRSFQGGFAFSKVEGITSPAYTVFGLKDTEQYPQFWAIKFASRKFIDYLKKVTIGIRDGRSIDVPAFMTLPETFPSLPEQRKIASCLSSADALIDQARAELKQWQEVKKSLLQQMFV